MSGRLITIERVALLHGVEFFSGLPGHVLATLAHHAEEVDLPAEAVLVEEGDEADCLYVVARGRVRVESRGRGLASLGPGEVVGELGALVPRPRSATVTTAEPSLFLRVGADAIDELLFDHPAAARAMIDVLAERLYRSAAEGSV